VRIPGPSVVENDCMLKILAFMLMIYFMPPPLAAEIGWY